MSAGDSLPVLSKDAAFDAPADVVSPQQVEWRGVDWHQVLAFAGAGGRSEGLARRELEAQAVRER